MTDSILHNKPLALVICFTICLLATPNAASSQETNQDTEPVEQLTDDQRKEAKGYFEQGSKHFSKGEFKEAIDQFRAAYDIVRSPEILWNIGRCHEELKESEEAIYNYEMYLRFYATAEDAEAVRQRIAILRELEKKETPTTEEAEPVDEVEKDSTRWFNGMAIGANLGFASAIMGPADGTAIPFELFGSYPLGERLSARLAINAGSYIDSTAPSSASYDVETQMGIHIGVKTNFDLSEKFSITAGANIGIKRLAFIGDRNWKWFTGDVNGGIDLKLGESNWSLISEAFVGFGLAWGEAVGSTPLDPGRQFQMEFGAKAGIKYTL